MKYSSIPYDQFTRQNIAASIINNVRSENQNFSVLDVGGYKGKTQLFLPKDKVTVVDLYDSNDKNYVKASGLDLPFKDQQFDFVLSFDVLEHIPSKDRNKFISECSRTAKRGVIICAPQFTKKNKTAEIKLNEFYERIAGKEHPWLSEHISNELPDFSKVKNLLQKNGLYTNQVFSNNLIIWLVMQSAYFTNEKYNVAAEKLINATDISNKEMGLDWTNDSEDSYREVIYGFRSKKDLYVTDQYIENSIHQRSDITNKVNFITMLLDYYLSTIEYLDKQNHEIKRQLEEAKDTAKYMEENYTGAKEALDNILESKKWLYVNKLGDIKNKLKVIGRRNG